MLNILLMDMFAKALARMNRGNLRVATQIMTGHAALNYHLSKVNSTVQPICSLCEAEEETVPIYLGNVRCLGN